MCFSFFFFKQKTAYEMRISDWSSDVCSSDLVNGALLSRAAVYVLKSLNDDDLAAMLDRAAATELGNLSFADDAKATLIASADGDGRKQIGRASCRERRCKYV